MLAAISHGDLESLVLVLAAIALLVIIVKR